MNPLSWALVILGVILVLVGLLRPSPKVKPPTPTEVRELSVEIKKRIEKRKQYLPQLKQLIADYINRVEVLANTAERLYDLDLYKQHYILTSVFIRQIAKRDETQAIIWELYKRNVWGDNIIFRQVQNEDRVLQDINLNIDTYNANVKDTQVRNFSKGLREAAHIAYSYVVFNKLCRLHWKGIPLEVKFRFRTARKMIDRLRELQNEVNQRIDELLEGVEDE